MAITSVPSLISSGASAHAGTQSTMVDFYTDAFPTLPDSAADFEIVAVAPGSKDDKRRPAKESDLGKIFDRAPPRGLSLVVSTVLPQRDLERRGVSKG